MKQLPKPLAILVASVAIGGLAFPTQVQANWDRGVAALKRGDYEKAAQELRPAAREGDVRAQYSLATLYLQGRGVEPDPEEAAKWLRQAAKAELAVAQTAMGRLYATGTGVERDDQAALRWYYRAAQWGDPAGQAALGIMLRAGRGAKADPIAAAMWLELAEQAGQGAASRHLVEVRRTLSTEDRERAEKLAKNWKPRRREERRPDTFGDPTGGFSGY